MTELDHSALKGELGEHGVVTAPKRGDGRWNIHGLTPRLVCTPPTAEALTAALAVCDRAGAVVVPWGGGCQQRLGTPPERVDVCLVTSRLNKVVEFEPANLTATVEAGLSLDDFQMALGERGQWLPLDPPLLPGATVGGAVATNVSGPRRLKEGGLRDLVIGTRVANVDGTLTRAGGRVVKNVTGYDLNKLHIGALGTLGMLTEVTFKVAPLPESERAWAGVFRSAGVSGGVYAAVSRLPLVPTALETLNDRAAQALGLATGEGRWVVLARASGFGPAVARHLAEFEAIAARVGVLEAEALPEERGAAVFTAYRELAADRRWRGDALTCRLAVPPAMVGTVCDRAAAIGQEPLVWAHAWGGVFWSAATAKPEQVLALRAVAESAGGRLVVENWQENPGGFDVWGEPGGPVALMRALKEQFDPRRTLNAGRYVGGI